MTTKLKTNMNNSIIPSIRYLIDSSNVNTSCCFPYFYLLSCNFIM